MKPQPAFVAERPVARHCPELIREGASERGGDALPRLALFGERLTRSFARALSRLSGTDAPVVSCSPPQTCTMAEIAAQTPALAANSLLGAGVPQRRLLASMNAASVLQLVDRAFGGHGEVPDPLPAAFPLSAELFVAKLEETLIAAITASLDTPAPPAVTSLRRNSSLSQLDAFPAETALTSLELTVSEDGLDPWSLTLALPAETTELLLSGCPGAEPGKIASLGAPDPAAEPFASMPISLRAVLVDMDMPFSRLCALRAGDVLPVSVARSVPLQIGGKKIAHGTIGEFEDRVAVQLTHAFR